MTEMQEFYESEIATDQANPYCLLAQVPPEAILTDDLLDWFAW